MEFSGREDKYGLSRQRNKPELYLLEYIHSKAKEKRNDTTI